MTDPEIVKKAFKGYVTVSDELAVALSEISVIQEFGKNARIYTKDTVASSVGIIVTGLVHSFIISENKEVTIWFGEDGDFITSFHSFFTGTEGFETIECIEDTSVLMIPIEAFKALVKDNKEMLFLYSVILEKSYIYWDNGMLIFTTVVKA
jgi:CRP-like cAMP-binding protein